MTYAAAGLAVGLTIGVIMGWKMGRWIMMRRYRQALAQVLYDSHEALIQLDRGHRKILSDLGVELCKQAARLEGVPDETPQSSAEKDRLN